MVSSTQMKHEVRPQCDYVYIIFQQHILNELTAYRKKSRLCTDVDCVESKGQPVIYDNWNDDLWFCTEDSKLIVFFIHWINFS